MHRSSCVPFREIAMTLLKPLILSIAIGSLAVPGMAQLASCDDDDAQRFADREINLCATMVGGVYLERATRRPTLLYFEPAFADHIFAAVIYGEDREKFGMPE